MNSEQLSDLIVAVLDDNKAQEIVKLDVRKLEREFKSPSRRFF